MGMDVCGKEPSSEAGEYFRNNVWWWRPLALYCESVAPTITAKCTHWQTNDGDGLDAAAAIALADALQAELDTGRTLIYAKKWAGDQEMMPNEPCVHCKGTGTRNDEYVKGTCNGCKGEGTVRPLAVNYPFEVDNVREFVAFLRACGGFEIC